MKLITILTLFFFIFAIFSQNFALDNLILKIDPNTIETNGELLYFNISVENIPQKGGIYSGMDGSTVIDEELDGGLGALDVHIDFSTENLQPIEFNWSENCKNEKWKEFKFENGNFYLSITFDETRYEDSVFIGTIVFSPKKESNTELSLSGTTSSDLGYGYSKISRIANTKTGTTRLIYPDTEFKGSEIIINGVKEYGGSTKLEDTFDDSKIASSSGSNVVYNIQVIPNQKEPEIIIKEVYIEEISPNITIIVKNNGSINPFLLLSIFFGSIISGAVFGSIFKGKTL
ncbi:hypothetical protein Mevan_0133 [Methanococcus vannielii SB]|uniref:Uncharacterized protein n=1 Tax=Methanococcus vannielii (strain ATCC 35089 / DSM 1224 / JCM 13029 / OCM 148 / SB) TaxID=406327 RepID=A6UNH2_METVS|nr:hypothetical protein [Methanococcus vannielii]ABR54044.1 hypothetical protein Mevan_0133 [Methanococcus vannielii SB]